MKFPDGGEGYIPNSKNINEPKLVKMNGIEMKFSKKGIPFTLYPIK
jgi:hypothetical protein